MKRNYFNRTVIMMTIILSFFLLSCSKEKIVFAPPAGEATANISAERVGKWGSITGMVLPRRAEVKIVVFNRYFSSIEYYYKRDGSFQFDKIPPGVYTVIIFDITTSRDYTINNVKVGAGTLINIGVIKLQ